MEVKDINDWEFQFSRVLNRACELLERNKGIKVSLDDVNYSKANQDLCAAWKDTYMALFTLHYPKALANLGIDSRFLKVEIARGLPYITNLIAREKLDLYQKAMNEFDFVSLCFAGWIYGLGRQYKYF